MAISRLLCCPTWTPGTAGSPMGPPPTHGAPFPGKKIRGYATKTFFRLRKAGGPMGPQIYDLHVLYT